MAQSQESLLSVVCTIKRGRKRFAIHCQARTHKEAGKITLGVCLACRRGKSREGEAFAAQKPGPVRLHAGAMLTEYQKVTSLLTYLLAMRGRRLWHYEDVSLTRLNLPSALALSALTSAILESIFFERDLRERWAAEALKWMMDSNSRHLACRSHQVVIPSNTESVGLSTM